MRTSSHIRAKGESHTESKNTLEKSVQSWKKYRIHSFLQKYFLKGYHVSWAILGGSNEAVPKAHKNRKRSLLILELTFYQKKTNK